VGLDFLFIFIFWGLDLVEGEEMTMFCEGIIDKNSRA
jgi:hypothetical protein